MSHLQKHHKDVFENTTKKWAEMQGKKAEEIPQKQAKTTSLNGVKMSGPALQLHSLRLITENGLSFKCLDYGAFQDIITPMLNAMPKTERPTISATTTPTKIHGLADRIRQKMAAEMENRLLSLQVDGCSKSYRQFMGINVQYIDDNGKVVVRTLAVEEIFISHTADNLKAIIVQILRKYGVSASQVVSFTSDNAGNYLLAGKLMGLEEAEDQFDENDNNAAWLNLSLASGGNDIQSVRCAAHTLQLAIEDAIKADTSIKPMLKAIRELAKFLRTPTNVRQLKEAGKSLPALDVITRWCSTFAMVRSVVVLRLFFEKTLQMTTKDRTQYGISEANWAAAQTFLDDMQPLYDATIKLQAKELTLGQFLGIWTKAALQLKRRPQSELVKLLQVHMEKRASAVMYKERGRGERLSSLFGYAAFNAAVFVDPRFFSLLTAEQVADAKKYLLGLWQKLQLLRHVQEVSEELSRSDEEDSPAAQESDDEDDFAKLLAQKNRERKQEKEGRGGQLAAAASASVSGRETLRESLDQFDRLAEPIHVTEDVLTFWKSKKLIWPQLYELAMIVLAIPATQVSVERLFSALRFILRPQRFNLSSENLDDIVFLHANSDLVRELAKELMNEKMETEFE